MEDSVGENPDAATYVNADYGSMKDRLLELSVEI